MNLRKSQVKAGFHKRRSRRRDQKRWTLRPNENKVLILLSDSTYDSVFTIKWKLGRRSRKQKRKNSTNHKAWECALWYWFIIPLLLPTPTIWSSLDHTEAKRRRRSPKGSRKKMETFWFFWLWFRLADYSAYDSDFFSYDSAYDSDSQWGRIDLVTVFDAILTSRQTCEKLQCLYGNLMSNNFRKTGFL